MQGNKVLFVKLDSLGDHIIFLDFLEKNNHFVNSKNKFTLITSQKKCDILFLNRNYRFKFNRIYNLNSFVIRIIQKSKLLRDLFFSYDYVVNPVFSRTKHQDSFTHLFRGLKVTSVGDSVNYHSLESYTVITQKYDIVLENDILSNEYVKYNIFIKEFFKKINKKVKNNIICIAHFANEVSRTWNLDNWPILINYIGNANESKFIFVCPKSHYSKLREILTLNTKYSNYTILRGSLAKQYSSILDSDLLICMDSSPYHYAVVNSLPVICISNGNHYSRFIPNVQNEHLKSEYIFPDEFNKLTLQDKIKLNLIKSPFDINSIHPASLNKLVLKFIQKMDNNQHV